MPSSETHVLDSYAEHLPGGFGVAALESIRMPAGVFGRDHRIIWINNVMGLIHRCRPKHVIGRQCHEVFKNCSTECAECCLTQVVETGRMVLTETWIDMPRGGRRWGDVYSYPVRNDKGEIDAVMNMVFDTTRHVLGRQRKEAPLVDMAPLSPRETEVLRLMAEGHTNDQISSVLEISAHTVKTYVTGIFNKLGVNDRTHAAVIGVRQNII